MHSLVKFAIYLHLLIHWCGRVHSRITGMAPASQRRKKDGKRHTKTKQGNEAEIVATQEKARDSVKDSKER